MEEDLKKLVRFCEGLCDRSVRTNLAAQDEEDLLYHPVGSGALDRFVETPEGQVSKRSRA